LRADRVQTGQRLGLVQRSEIGQRAQPLADPFVDPDRSGESGAPMDDAVPDYVRSRKIAQHAGQCRGVAGGVGRQVRAAQ